MRGSALRSKLRHMNFRFGCALTITLAGSLVAFAQNVLAQSPAVETTPTAGVILTKLSPPAYPLLARQARVAGDVELQVRIAKDGSVETVGVISGHPMLKQAALESARKSTFECRGCRQETISYFITYTFALADSDCNYLRPRAAKCLYMWRCGDWRHNTENRMPEVTQSLGHVTILAASFCVETETAH